MIVPIHIAYRFIKPLAGGTTRPWLIEVDTGKDFPERFVLKLFSKSDLEQENYIAHEILGSALARSLDLRTPGIALIKLTDDFKATVPELQLKDLSKCPEGLKFASAHILGQEYSATLHSRYLTKDDFPTIFAFDMLIANTDRNLRKPNMLIADQQFYLFDHERAFGFEEPDMRKLGYLIKDHLLYPRVKKLFRFSGENLFDTLKFYLEELRFTEIHPLLTQLEGLQLAGEKERRWIEYVEMVQSDPVKFINLLIQHLE